MTVYLVWREGDNYDGGDTLMGVYTTRAMAEQVAAHYGLCEIREEIADVMPEPHAPSQPIFERELTPLEKVLADACNRQLEVAYSGVKAKWFWAPPGYEAAAKELLENTNDTRRST